MTGHYGAMIPYRNPGFAVGWGTLAMINGSIAENKGRSPVTWSLLSMVGGPVVTFYLVYFAAPKPIPVPIVAYNQNR